MRRLWDFADDHREHLAITLLLGGMLAAAAYFLAQPSRGDQQAAQGSGVATDAGGVAVSPPPVPSSEVTSASPVTGTESPTPAPVASPTADLAALRASDAFLAFAEPARSLTAPTNANYTNFSQVLGEERVEWTNKEQLWRDTAMAIRDQALQVGPEATRPMWDTRNVVPAGVAMIWSDEVTGGRGQAARFRISYDDGGEPVDRIWLVLIGTDADSGAGSVLARMEPFDVREADALDLDAAVAAEAERLWAWVQTKPEQGAGQ